MRGAGLREDDSIEEVQQVMDHDNLMFFTSDGKMYVLKAYQIPEASRTAQGSSFSSVRSLPQACPCLSGLCLDHTYSAIFHLVSSMSRMLICKYTCNACVYSWQRK